MPKYVPMDPGERDRIITIQQRSSADAVDDSGAPVETWTTLVASMPASRRYAQARERFTADQLSSKYDVVFEVNYRADMDPDLVDVPKLRRVLFHGRIHDIVAANQIGMREGVELLTLASGRTA
jgi:SPP1 family predicted phage head-tail adaptor